MLYSEGILSGGHRPARDFSNTNTVKVRERGMSSLNI